MPVLYTIVYSECTCLSSANVLCVQLSEYFSQLLALTEFLECNFGVTFGIAITHNHGNVATYTLSTESSFGEACSHREEVYDTGILGTEN